MQITEKHETLGERKQLYQRYHIGSIDNKIQNNEMLRFVRQTMNKEQFEKLYKSYRQLFWF